MYIYRYIMIHTLNVYHKYHIIIYTTNITITWMIVVVTFKHVFTASHGGDAACAPVLHTAAVH